MRRKGVYNVTQETFRIPFWRPHACRTRLSVNQDPRRSSNDSNIDRGTELPHIDRLLTALSLEHETCGQTVDHRGASNPRVSRKLEPITCAVSSVIGAQHSHVPITSYCVVRYSGFQRAKALQCRNPDEVTMGISGYFRQGEVSTKGSSDQGGLPDQIPF